jgi:predicted flap endonuclease-1-like 5' DNA nuclease
MSEAVLVGIGTAVAAVAGGAIYTYFTGNTSSVDVDDDGNDDVTFEGENEAADEEVAEVIDSGTPPIYTDLPVGLEGIKGIGPTRAETLRNAGYVEPADVAKAPDEDLRSLHGFGEHAVQQIRDDIGYP